MDDELVFHPILILNHSLEEKGTCLEIISDHVMNVVYLLHFTHTLQ